MVGSKVAVAGSEPSKQSASAAARVTRPAGKRKQPQRLVNMPNQFRPPASRSHATQRPIEKKPVSKASKTPIKKPKKPTSIAFKNAVRAGGRKLAA